MAIELNHTIVHGRDARESAEFFAEVFGVGPPKPFGPFIGVEVANGVTLDFLSTDEEIQIQHYAFLVSDAEFDAGFARIQEKGLTYWADPARQHPGEINRHWGGRGVSFEDPDGHFLELITKPYGSEKDL